MRRVLPPETSFERIAAQLSAAGWQRAHVSGLRPPLRPGEPELARFERDTRSLTYSFNPVIGLRILDGDLDTTLEGVAKVEVERWLASADPRAAARGCLSAAEMGLTALRTAVAEAASHLPDPLQPMGQAALRRLDPLPEGSRTAAFDVLPVTMRLQILRHMLRDDPAAAAAVIPGCWSDGPELAATAMIAAARLGLADQGLAVKRADLSGMAVNRRDREVFTALKKACLASLQGQSPGPEDLAKNRFWRLVLGQTDPADDTGLLIHALTTPLPEPAQTRPPPDGFCPDGFCTVPVVAHRLGHGLADGLPNPLHLWTPDAPLTLQIRPSAPVGVASISAELTAASHETGHPLRLPLVEEWEAALRGPDGRPYPWGVSPTPAGLAASPWGALWSGHPEWALHHGVPVLCGADPKGRVAYVEAPGPRSRAGVRGVIQTPESI